jgi:hypothetical protein
VLLPSLGPPPRLAVSGCACCRPTGPLAVTRRPSAPRPGVPPLQSLNVLVPPPQGPGASPNPGDPRPAFLQGGFGRPLLGLDALRLRGPTNARCAAGRLRPLFGPLSWRPSPAVRSTCSSRPPRCPTAVFTCVTLRLCAPTAAFAGGPGVSSSSRAWRLSPASPLVRC